MFTPLKVKIKKDRLDVERPTNSTRKWSRSGLYTPRSGDNPGRTVLESPSKFAGGSKALSRFGFSFEDVMGAILDGEVTCESSTYCLFWKVIQTDIAVREKFLKQLMSRLIEWFEGVPIKLPTVPLINSICLLSLFPPRQIDDSYLYERYKANVKKYCEGFVGYGEVLGVCLLVLNGDDAYVSAMVDTYVRFSEKEKKVVSSGAAPPPDSLVPEPRYLILYVSILEHMTERHIPAIIDALCKIISRLQSRMNKSIAGATFAMFAVCNLVHSLLSRWPPSLDSGEHLVNLEMALSNYMASGGQFGKSAFMALKALKAEMSSPTSGFLSFKTSICELATPLLCSSTRGISTLCRPIFHLTDRSDEHAQLYEGLIGARAATDASFMLDDVGMATAVLYVLQAISNLEPEDVENIQAVSRTTLLNAFACAVDIVLRLTCGSSPISSKSKNAFERRSSTFKENEIVIAKIVRSIQCDIRADKEKMKRVDPSVSPDAAIPHSMLYSDPKDPKKLKIRLPPLVNFRHISIDAYSKSVTSQMLDDLLMSAYQSSKDNRVHVVLRIVLAGGHSTFHTFLRTWATVLAREPALRKAVDCELFVLPLRRIALAEYIAKRDALYNRQVYSILQRNKSFIPECSDTIQSSIPFCERLLIRAKQPKSSVNYADLQVDMRAILVTASGKPCPDPHYIKDGVFSYLVFWNIPTDNEAPTITNPSSPFLDMYASPPDTRSSSRNLFSDDPYQRICEIELSCPADQHLQIECDGHPIKTCRRVTIRRFELPTEGRPQTMGSPPSMGRSLKTKSKQMSLWIRTFTEVDTSVVNVV
eukprot:20407_1